MRRLTKNKNNQKGVAIIGAYLVLVVLIIFASAFLSRTIYQNRSIIIFNRRVQAFNLAEAGLDRAIDWFRAQPSPPTGGGNLWAAGAQTLGASGTTNTPVIGTYNIVITDLGEPAGSPGTRRYRVTSTGTISGGTVTRQLQNYIQTDNYARYIWFTDRETYSGSKVWFVTRDFLDGPTHTNAHYHMYGFPTFAGEVQSVDNYIDFYHRSNDQNFPGEIKYDPEGTANDDIPDFQVGYTFGAQGTNMPSQASNLRAASNATGGMRLQGNSTVVLNTDGTMNVTNAARGWNNQNMALPANGALFVACGGRRCANGGTLTISGTLSGRLTAGAERNVFIPNNVVYNDDPRENPVSNDTLGIIAEQNIILDDNGPNNLEINASVMALNTSFMLENYASAPAKGTLTVYGGIIQDERGPVGTFSGFDGSKLSGYDKNYSWDARLLASPPPFFPTTGDYLTLSWEEN